MPTNVTVLAFNHPVPDLMMLFFAQNIFPIRNLDDGSQGIYTSTLSIDFSDCLSLLGGSMAAVLPALFTAPLILSSPPVHLSRWFIVAVDL